MELQFQGLIVHARVTDPDDGIERQIAVLMAAPAHVPFVSLDPSHVREGTDAHGKCEEDVCCFTLKDRVTSNLGSGLAKKVDLPSVPKLKKVASGGGAPDTPKENVKKRKPDTKFHAYVELPPGGDLVELDYFATQVAFNGTSFGCIARTVRYVVPASGGDVTFLINGKKLIVADDAVLYIQNASLKGSSAPPHPHFPEYCEFFEPKATAIHSPDKTGQPECRKPLGEPLPSCSGPISLDVDCSNSQFP